MSKKNCLWDPRTDCNTVFGTPEPTATLFLVAESLILVAEPLILVAEPLILVAEPNCCALFVLLPPPEAP